MTRRALGRGVALTIGLASLVLLGACGDGVQPREGASGASTTTTGGGSSFVPPETGPTDVPAGEDPAEVLGEDPELDTLAQACFEGDLLACDTLFLRSDVGGDLEAYSQTCGGRIERQNGAPACADRFDAVAPAPEAPGELGADAELDALAAACFDGDAGACDDLYLRSPVDSDYEAYGATCGGRLALASDGGCESQFGSG